MRGKQKFIEQTINFGSKELQREANFSNEPMSSSSVKPNDCEVYNLSLYTFLAFTL